MLSAIIMLIEMLTGEWNKRGSENERWFGSPDDESFACPNCGYVPEQGYADGDFAIVAWDCPECGHHITEPGAVLCSGCGEETLPRFNPCNECRDA